MGLFDPPYKKMLAKCPPDFVAMIVDLDPQMVEALRAQEVPANGLDLSRSIIYSILIARLSNHYGTFSADALRFAQINGQNAYRVFPKQFIPVVDRTVHVVLTLIEKRTGVKLTLD